MAEYRDDSLGSPHPEHLEEGSSVFASSFAPLLTSSSSLLTSLSTSSSTSSYSPSSIPAKMTIYYHNDCSKHLVPEEHPEIPMRVEYALEKLRERTNYPFEEAPLATKDHILLFHTEEHWNYVNQKFRNVEFLTQSDPDASDYIDSDTNISKYTEAAALRAVGSAIRAVDDIYLRRVMMGTNSNMITSDRSTRTNTDSGSSNPSFYSSSFCLVRPPGHHAEPERACGFCFFNAAGIAAKYARSKYGVGRVAVLDFDVHHGNGTEEGFKDDENLFYGSTHEENNFPGTGPEPLYIGNDFRTLPLHRRIVNRKTRSGMESKSDFRMKWKEIMQELVVFAPNLVIISAGFDAHARDPVGNSYLVEEDFKWATEAVFKALNKVDPYNSIPVISVLEGGYDIPALADSILVHVDALERGYECCHDGSQSDDDNEDLFAAAEGSGNEVAAMARYIESLGLGLDGLNTSINSDFNDVFREDFRSAGIDDNSEHNLSAGSISTASNAMSTSIISSSWTAFDQDILGDFIAGVGSSSRLDRADSSESDL